MNRWSGPIFFAFAVHFFLSSPPAPGQLIRGWVLDEEGLPVEGATISVLAGSLECLLATVSDSTGFFRGPVPGPGDFWLSTERLGFRASRTGPLRLEPGDSVDLELRLSVEAIPMEPLTVNASRRPWWEHLEPPALWSFWERREYMDKLGLGVFATSSELDPLSGASVSQAISDLAPFFEMYRGASDVPGEFRDPGSHCGAVAIWTKRE